MTEMHLRVKVDVREGIPTYETPVLDQWVEGMNSTYAFLRIVIRKEYWTNLRVELEMDPTVVLFKEIDPEPPVFHLGWAEKLDGELTGLRSHYRINDNWISVKRMSDRDFRRKVAGQNMPLLRRMFLR